MAKFYARMMDASTGGEDRCTLEACDDHLQQPADEAFDLFFDHVAAEVLHHSSDWKLNSVMRTHDRNIITAMGAFLRYGDPQVPSLLMNSSRE